MSLDKLLKQPDSEKSVEKKAFEFIASVLDALIQSSDELRAGVLNNIVLIKEIIGLIGKLSITIKELEDRVETLEGKCPSTNTSAPTADIG